MPPLTWNRAGKQWCRGLARPAGRDARRLCVVAAHLAACALTPASRAGSRLKHDESRLPYRRSWGRYTVRVEKTGAEPYSPDRLRIQDARGETVRELRGFRILRLDFPHLQPGGPPALQVSAFTGGAHCCFRTYFFSRNGGLRNLLIFNGGNCEITAIRDLDGDGRPEILAGNDALAYFGELPYAFSPQLELVIGWRGTRYVDVTRWFPGRSRMAARPYREQFRKALHSRESSGEAERRGAAAGYYANMAAAGRQTDAYRWLMRRMPEETWQWFVHHAAALRAATRTGGHTLSVSQARVLCADQEIPTPPATTKQPPAHN